jgi:hypothetical protein
MLEFRVEVMRRASREFFSDMEPRPSLRPLAPLIGTLAGLWLGAAGLIVAQLL